MPNPFLQRQAERGSAGHGTASEKRINKALGARQQPASGAMAGAKSDGILKAAGIRMEMKSTTADTMRLERGWLVKISDEARAHGQTPALVISFVNADGKPVMAKDAEWVAIPLSMFKEVVG